MDETKSKIDIASLYTLPITILLRILWSFKHLESSPDTIYKYFAMKGILS
jgi:hypothetical protein